VASCEAFVEEDVEPERPTGETGRQTEEPTCRETRRPYTRI